MLSPELKAQIEKLAAEEGVDADALAAAVEARQAKAPPPAKKPPSDAGGASKPPAEVAPKPAEQKLFQYHMPFVLVREVRARLGLSEKFPGDDEIAADWMAKHPMIGTADQDAQPKTPEIPEE